MTENPSAPAATDPTDPIATPAAAESTAPVQTSATPISESEYTALIQRMEAQTQSIEKLTNKNSELIGKQKTRKAEAENALRENGEFRALADSQAETLAAERERINALEADAITARVTAEAYAATQTEITGFVAAEMEPLTDVQRAQLQENILAYSGGPLDKMPPMQQLKAVRLYRSQLTGPNGLGQSGTGDTAGAKANQLAKARESGNVREMLRLQL